jgi:hypothetical protein
VNLKEIEHAEEIVILSGFMDDFFKYTYAYLLENKNKKVVLLKNS